MLIDKYLNEIQIKETNSLIVNKSKEAKQLFMKNNTGIILLRSVDNKKNNGSLSPHNYRVIDFFIRYKNKTFYSSAWKWKIFSDKMILWDESFDPVLAADTKKSSMKFSMNNEIIKLSLSNKSFTDVPQSTHGYITSLANFEIEPNSVKLKAGKYSDEIKEVRIKRHLIPPKVINFNIIRTDDSRVGIGGSYEKIILTKE